MKTLSNIEPSPFASAYIECALWSSTDDAGNPLDSSHNADDIDACALADMVREADEFASANRADIEAAGLDDSRAGYCFWLNRNGHGSGFWDAKMTSAGDPDNEVAACNRLSDASHKAGSRDLYVGDDGKIYQS